MYAYPSQLYSLYEQFQDSFVVGVHIIFFVPIGSTLCTVWNADRQADLKLGNGYLGCAEKRKIMNFNIGLVDYGVL